MNPTASAADVHDRTRDVARGKADILLDVAAEAVKQALNERVSHPQDLAYAVTAAVEAAALTLTVIDRRAAAGPQ